MEKLINLYYEHKLDLLKREMRVNGATEREVEMADIEKVEEEELEENLNKLSDLKPFIKWLVENDKIDREQKIKEFRLQIEIDDGRYGELGGADRLLMLISISDTPIDDLISYLK